MGTKRVMLVNRPPSVGFLTCSSYRVNPEAVQKKHEQTKSQLLQICTETECKLVTAPGIARSDEELSRDLGFLGEQELSAFVLHYAGWTEDQTILKIVDTFPPVVRSLV